MHINSDRLEPIEPRPTGQSHEAAAGNTQSRSPNPLTLFAVLIAVGALALSSYQLISSQAEVLEPTPLPCSYPHCYSKFLSIRLIRDL